MEEEAFYECKCHKIESQEKSYIGELAFDLIMFCFDFVKKDGKYKENSNNDFENSIIKLIQILSEKSKNLKLFLVFK